jgi:formylglycine-generating enzyme required for sulfatase activity
MTATTPARWLPKTRTATAHRPPPTEAEWEAAARCGEDLRYAGSGAIDDVAWYSESNLDRTHPVGDLAPTPVACMT